MTINWKNDLPLPMARPRYYDHQYLRAADLSQAVDYLLSRQNLAARLLHPVGVVRGLELTPTGSDVTVAEGAAVDVDGLLIVVPEGRRISLPGDGTFYVTLRHLETLTDRRDEGGVAAETRWTEEGRVEVGATAPGDPGRRIVLGRVTRSQGVVTVDNGPRVLAGLRVPVGAIVPAVGDTRQAGIQFPAGATSDEAFIRYHPVGGENTVLRIANLNDPEDAIVFAQAGDDRLRISNSMLHLGSLNGVAVRPDQVVAGLGFWGPGVQHAQLSFRAGRGFELVDQSGTWPTLDYPAQSRPYADLQVRELGAGAVRGRGGLNVVTDGQVAVRAAGGLTVVSESGASGNLSVQGAASFGGDITLGVSRYITALGRLHLSGTERLYLLNKEGVYVGFNGSTDPEVGCLWVEKRGFFGGNVQVNGNLGVKAAPNSMPDGLSGVVAQDVYAVGAVYAGAVGGPARIKLDAATGIVYCLATRTTLPYPLLGARAEVDPLGGGDAGPHGGGDDAGPHGGGGDAGPHGGGDDELMLVHSGLQGPEDGVYYRGEGRLVDGAATVELPEYFEALTRLDGRTVQLTPVLTDDEPVSALAASRVAAGQFRVRTVDGATASHAFFWQVNAVRVDVDPLEPVVGVAALTAGAPPAAPRPA